MVAPPWKTRSRRYAATRPVPDAFAGPLAPLLCILEDGTGPEVSGRDKLETIALCEAVYAAAQEYRETAGRELLS